MTDLVIAGLARLSTCDWPGKLVATVFLQGCPWRCGYCQNPSLADCATPGATTWAKTLGFLSRRRGLLDGVVFSGGEPTRQPGLVDALAQVRGLGFATGLHTAGAYPKRLGAALPLLDWVGLDIKAPPATYDRITGVKSSADKAFQSLRLVLEAGVDYEVRITVDPTSHTGDDIYQLVGLLQSKGVRNIVLQEARAEGTSPEYAKALAGSKFPSLGGVAVARGQGGEWTTANSPP